MLFIWLSGLLLFIFLVFDIMLNGNWGQVKDLSDVPRIVSENIGDEFMICVKRLFFAYHSLTPKTKILRANVEKHIRTQAKFFAPMPSPIGEISLSQTISIDVISTFFKGEMYEKNDVPNLGFFLILILVPNFE